ncbi:MAG: SIR2 family protein [Nitrospirae bacterium]|nr:SIR2 family protein [Nitrospirota bacterium]
MKRIFDIWGKANNLVKYPNVTSPLGVAPRLESVLGEIDNLQAKTNNCDFNFMEGFNSFLNAPYNEKHLHIAHLITLGADVISTNFDYCVQKAYSSIEGDNDYLVRYDVDNISYFKSKGKINSGTLWHIHGVAENIRNLGATIRVIKDGLNIKFQEYLEKRLHDGCALIFLGYSLSDYFDVNMYFTSKQNNIFKNSFMAFVQHTGSQFPDNIKELISLFRNYKLEETDTTEYLALLTGCKYASQFLSNKWEAIFISKTSLINTYKIKYILLCKISNMLGININLLDLLAFQKAVESEDYFEPFDFFQTLAITCRLPAMVKEALYYDKKSYNIIKTSPDLLGYYYEHGDLRRALSLTKSLEQLFEDAKSTDKELGWSTYTSMSVHCRLIVLKLLKTPFSKKIRKEDLLQIDKLFKLTYLLSHRPLKDNKYVNQVTTALRFHLIFQTIIDCKLNVNLENKILKAYGEIASISGFVGSYRDISLANYFSFKYNSKKSSLCEAIEFANKSIELSQLIGDFKGIKRAKRLLYLFKLNKII